ncbi:MAG: hypothetical protein ACI9JN_001144 [Bacteroidia bacterium]|jgi:hypothetical protein
MKMRVNFLICGLLVSALTYGQHFGNAPNLKYGISETNLYADVSIYGFTLSNSPSKRFLLQNLSNFNFSSPTSFNTISRIIPVESSGEGIKLGQYMTSNKLSVGGSYLTKERNEAHATWNTLIFKKKTDNRLRLTGMVIRSSQSAQDNREGMKWVSDKQNFNGYLKLSNYQYNAKNSFSWENFVVLNSNNFRLAPEGLDAPWLQNERGSVAMSKVNWTRRISENHIMIGEIGTELFKSEENAPQSATTDFKRFNISVRDIMNFRKNKLNNTLSVSSNDASMQHTWGQQINRYQLTMWQSSIVHFLKPKVMGFKYNHGIGYHSNAGFILNPGLKFFHNRKSLKYDVGFLQTSRTPALLSEFQTHFRTTLSPSVVSNPNQETIRKVYGTAHFQIYSLLSLEFKYINTFSKDKWLFDPIANRLKQAKWAHSSVYAKLARNNQIRSKYHILYRYTMPETKSAEVLPQHLVSASYEYKIHRRTVHLKSFRRLMDFSVHVTGSYVSEQQLPYLDDGHQAIQEDGVFVDSHLLLTLKKRAYYYQQDHKIKYLEEIKFRMGVNNVLDTSTAIQPQTANPFKPFFSRQLYVGISLGF